MFNHEFRRHVPYGLHHGSEEYGKRQPYLRSFHEFGRGDVVAEKQLAAGN